MIDILKDELVPIRAVPGRLPRQPNGKTVNLATVYRWMQRGVCGGIRLEFAKVGGMTYTSVEALQLFSERVTAARTGGPAPPPAPPASRRRRIEQARRQVEEIFRRKPGT